MISIFKRELKSYFINMTGYVFIGVIWIFSGIFSTAINFIGQIAAYEYVMSNLTTVLMFVIPILAMRSMAEDRRAKTDMLLYSLPINSLHIVLGKYFAMLAVYGVACLGMSLMPIILSLYGEVHFASAYSAILGFFLLGAALIAVCTFFSSFTENQLIAAVSGIAASLGLYLLGTLVGMIPTASVASFIGFAALALLLTALVYYLTRNYIITLTVGCVTVIPLSVAYLINPDMFASAFPKAVAYLALFDRFNNFLNGIFDVGAIVYYISFAIFFIFLTVQSLDKRRWS